MKTFAKPGGRYDKELKKRVSWWEHDSEHFPRTNFPAGSKTSKGHSIDLQTGEVREVAESVVAALLDGKKFDPKELDMGRKVEKEHTDDPDEAEEIAKDHLREPGHKRYYTRLKKAGLADELEECEHCAHGTPREQELERLGWKRFWGAGIWLNPTSTYQVGVQGLEDYPEDEWQQILSMTNAERPKTPPKADIMPGGGEGGPVGDNTAIGVGGGGGV